MRCKECLEFIADYTTGTLPENQRIAFNGHLANCPDCVAYIEGYEQSVKLSHACCCHQEEIETIEIPEQLVIAIIRARLGELG